MEATEWEDLDKNTRDAMKELGCFTPTANVRDRQVKGYMLDEDGDGCKVYWDSGDLRTIAARMIEVADWLDKRASV